MHVLMPTAELHIDIHGRAACVDRTHETNH
jgi:hypothetical protein